MKCEACGRSFKVIAQHYFHNPSHRPKLPDETHELIRGLLLGKGILTHREATENCKFQLNTNNKQFVEWLDEKLGEFSNVSATQVPDYQLNTRANPELNKYQEWYESDRHSYPVMHLSPLELKMWYVGKGHLLSRERYDRPYIRFECKTEALRPRIVREIFSKHGFDSYWRNRSFRFSVEQSHRLCEFMGDPPPGFESKWPDSDTAE